MKEVVNDISGTSTLVSRLSKSEKAHISKALSQSKGHTSHQHLFEILCKAKPLEEKEIRSLFEKKTKQKNYVLIKSQLLELILNTLSNINNDPSNEYALFKKLEQAQILSNKELYSQALKLCHVVLKTAIKLDFFSLQLKAFEQIIEIAIHTKSLKDIEFALEGMNEIAKKQIQYNRLLSLTHKANITFFTKSGKEDFSPSFEKIIEELKEPEDDSTRIKSYYYHLKGFIFLVYKCDYPEALKYFKKNMALITKDKAYLKSHHTAYQTALHNMAMCYDNLNNEQAYFDLFKEDEKLIPAKDRKAEDFAYNTVLKQTFLQTRGKHHEVIALSELQEPELQKLFSVIPSGIKLVCCINTYMSCIHCHEWKKALKWNNMVLNEHFDQIQDLSMFNRLANLIIHLELGNMDLIESLLPNIQRYLSSYGFYTGIFKDIHFFFKEIVNDYDGKQEIKLLNTLKQKLSTAIKQPSFNLQEAIQFVIDWIDDRMKRLE